MLRTVKVLLVLAIGIWGLIGAFGNLLNWPGVVGSVKAVTSMSTWQIELLRWRAISNPTVIQLGAAMIPTTKLLFGMLCLAGTLRMWRARFVGGPAFEEAKSLALAGCGIALLMLFGGWIVIADSWFEGWRSEAMQKTALATAFRYAGFVGIIALFVAQRDDVSAAQ